MTNRIQQSYESHIESEKGIIDLPSCISDPRSIDAYRHQRMLEFVMPVIESVPAATLMTIGDGRYGSDAFVFQKEGFEVTATSISDATLKVALEKGFIKKYDVQNAEKLSLLDNAYDFIVCKESYHHFPRPAIGFYEMFRVARKGLILIEPIESKKRIFDILKVLAKKVLRKEGNVLFEEDRNFIYRLSIREIEKMMTAMGETQIAVKTFNDFYFSSLSRYRSNKLSGGLVLFRLGIFMQNLLCFLRLMNYGLGILFTFKGELTSDIRKKLIKNGYKIIDLPKNPYRSAQ